MSQQENASLVTHDGEPVMLLGVKAAGDLRGLMFEATVEQRYCNPTPKNVEVVYTFPLPWGAVLLGVDVLLGDKQLTGAVVERKFAEARYEEALSEGHAAIMLEKNIDQSYSLNLGNLAASESCVITLRYAQTLQFEQRGLRLLIPTVIAPRFGDAVTDGGLQPHQAPIHSLSVEYPFTIELRLHGDMARARVASPSHPVGIAHSGAAEAEVLTVSLGRSASLDRDFVLVIDQLAHDSVALVAPDMVETDAIVALASFCPRIRTEEKIHTAVKILVDCSGSMAGNSIEAARRALQAIVRGLEKGDRFSLSRFGSDVEHRARGLWSVTETTRLAAQRWVGGLDADLGGTAMESALTSTFALAHTGASDVLLVTDGEISAIDTIIRAAQASRHRVFVVGIGSSPAEAHLRRLAEATGGACDFVAPGEAVEPAILRMFARLRSARLSDVSVVWPEGFTPEWFTAVPKSVFDGDTVNLFAFARQVPSGTVRLMGRVASDGDMREIACADLSAEIQNDTTVSRMAVADRLQLRNTAQLAELKSTSRDMAVAYQLVTEQTNFLLVHERTEEQKPDDMPQLHKVSQMLAAGWGGTGDLVLGETHVRYRVGDASGIISCAVARTDGLNDIPAFCRKQVSAPAVFRQIRREPQEEKVGRNPMSLCTWLRSMPEINWPSSYADLHQIGVDRWVVEWLEIAVAAKHAKAVTESIIVRSFLHAMAQRETFEMLSLCSDAPPRTKGIVKKMAGLFASVHGKSDMGVDLELSAEIAKTLQCMTASSWPDHVIDLNVESAESSACDSSVVC